MAEPTERIAILLELQQQEFQKKAKSAGAAIDRLERKYSPLAAAEAKLEKQQLRFNAALEAGTIDAAKHAKGMDLVQREYEQSADRAKRLTTNVVAMNSSVAAQTGFMTRNRSVFQQAGYQVGDFAVQVQGGQSALVAFSQQGSQLLGVFGPWGAVMGAALAVGSSLAGVLWTLGDATEETKEKARTFTDRLEDADAALAAMNSTASNLTDLEGLRKKYGELTDEVRDMAIALFEIDKRAAVKEVTGIIAEVTGEISKASAATAGTVTAALARSGTEAGKSEAKAYRLEIEAMQSSIDSRSNQGIFIDPNEINQLREMREELAAMEGDFAGIGSLVSEVNISPELLNQISQAQAGLESARDAGDFSSMADQLSLIRNLLIEAGDTVSQDVLDGVTNSEARARELAERLHEGGAAAEGIADADMSGGIDVATAAAMKLAEQLGIALSVARQIVAANAAAQLDEMSFKFSPGGQALGKYGNRGEKRDVPISDSDGNVLIDGKFVDPNAPKATTSGSGSRGGNRSKEVAPLFSIAESELENLQRSIEMVGKSKSEIAALTTKHKLLDEAKKRGMALSDELLAQIDAEAAGVGVLAEEYDLARDKVAALEKIQGEFKDSVIDAAMGGSDAMDAFKDSIKRAAIEYALFGTGQFASISGGSSGGGFLGGLFGGGSGGGFFGGLFGGARAGGGPVSAGVPYLVNENTANSELFVPSQSGAILNVPQAQKALSGKTDNSARISVEVSVNDSGKLVAVAQEAGANAALPIAVSVVNDNNRKVAQRQRR